MFTLKGFVYYKLKNNTIKYALKHECNKLLIIFKNLF